MALFLLVLDALWFRCFRDSRLLYGLRIDVLSQGVVFGLKLGTGFLVFCKHLLDLSGKSVILAFLLLHLIADTILLFADGDELFIMMLYQLLMGLGNENIAFHPICRHADKEMEHNKQKYKTEQEGEDAGNELIDDERTGEVFGFDELFNHNDNLQATALY